MIHAVIFSLRKFSLEDIAIKDTFYFPHDYNARGDEKIINMLRIHGLEGYGAYWFLIEKLYESGGRIAADFDAIAYDLRAKPGMVESVATKFGLFYFTGSPRLLASKSVDRRLQERRDRSKKASASGKMGAVAKHSPSDCQATATLERKERKEITTAAPSAVDLSKMIEKMAVDKSIERFFSEAENALDRRCAIRGEHHGRKFIDIPFDYAEAALIAPSLLTMGASQRKGFEARVELKKQETAR